MIVDDLKKYYGVKHDFELAKKVGYSKGAISKWRNKGICLETQAILQIKTNGKLKADIEQIDHLTA